MLFRAVVFLAVVVLGGCSTPDPPPAAPPQQAVATGTPGRTSVVGQAPVGAVVTLEPAVARAYALPAGPAILDQYAKNFVPDLLIVRVGQRVEFRNSEDVDHNVAVIRSPTGTRVFDTSTPSFQKYDHTFDRAGRYEVTCDVHPGMRATILATTTPYATVIDGTGRFSFVDLEPGHYTLSISGTRSLERKLEVAGAQVDLGMLIP